MISLLRSNSLTDSFGRRGIPVIMAAFILTVLNPAFAQEPDAASRKPIKITSDQMEADKKSGLVKFKGNVVVIHEDATIMSRELTVFYDSNNEMKQIDAVGDVRINQKDRMGTCNKATYFPGEKKIIMNGEPRLWREDGIISGSLITIYLDSDKMDVDDAVFNVRPKGSKSETPVVENGKEN